MFSATPQRMSEVATALATVTSSVTEWQMAATRLMAAHGYLGDSAAVAASVDGCVGWARTWAASLNERADLLDGAPAWPLGRVALTHLSHAWPAASVASVVRTAPGMRLAGGAKSSGRIGHEEDQPVGWGSGLDVAALSTMIGWLTKAELLPVSVRDVLMGRLLARRLMQSGGDPGATGRIAGLVARHVVTPSAAAAFMNSIEPGLLPNFASLAGAGRFDARGRARFMDPFARVLALASHSDQLGVDVDSLVSGREAGWWFSSGDFDLDLLLTALVAAVRRSDDWHGELGETFAVGDQRFQADGRVAILERLAEHGRAVGRVVVGRLATAGLLAGFVRPGVGYPDAGAAAGQLVAWLAADPAHDSAGLMARLIEAIALHGGADGILAGAAAIVVQHLGSLAPGGPGSGIPATPLRPALANLAARDAILHGFLRHVMADRARAGLVFAAVPQALRAALAMAIDPARPNSVADVFADAGRIYDALGDAYFDAAFDRARAADRARAVVQSVLGTALELGIGAVGGALVSQKAQLLMPGGTAVFDAWRAGALDEEQSPATEVESVLLETLDLERALVLQALLLLGGELARTGAIELPTEWLDSSVAAISLDQWDALADELEAIGFPANEWFNHAYAIGGFFDFDPAGD